MQNSAATLPSGFTSLVLTADFTRVAPNDQQAVEAFIQKRHGFFGASHVIFAETGRVNDTAAALLAEHQKPVVITSAYAPFTDFSALNEAAAHSGAVTFLGMVPGTEIIEYRPVSEGVSAKVTLGTQAQYGSQLNLRKYKRLKVFIAAIRKWPDMAEMHIANLMAHLKQHQSFFLNYAVEAPLVHHKVCPHCKHAGFTPLPATYSQALTGYTLSGTTAYFECQACGLIVMSPHISPENFKEFYDAYDAADMFFAEEDILQGSPRHNHQIVLDKLPSLLPQRTPPDPITALDIGGGPGLYSACLLYTSDAADEA
ncbi:MAG: hypothetical protein KUG56_03245, partial [Kordiimonadaceae bacterium]|nr:hypothetical protein [Kordiimonadaceae bacterium]